jgi:hypothetical protein
MKINNKHGFGPIVFKWLTFDEYDYHPGVYSATTLLQPLRITLLKERHWHEAEMDAEGLIASRDGTSIHDSFEKSTIDMDDVKQEERLFADIDDYKVSGKFDQLIHLTGEINGPMFQVWLEDTFGLPTEGIDWVLGDIKTTSVNSWIFKSNDDKYAKQMSIYRWLLVQNGYENVAPYAIITQKFHDWSKSKLKESQRKGYSYPEVKIQEFPVELMSVEETEKYIKENINDIYTHKETSDEELPRCPDGDLWRTEEKWAIMKPDADRAWRIFDNEEDAKDFWSGLKKPDDYIIEHRPGMVKRCLKYCPYYKWCNQYEEFLKEGLIPDEYLEK